MQTIIVDMTPGFRMPTIYYSQGDVGTQFAIDLRSRFGDSFPTGTTVTIQATKPSGFGFSVSADSTTGGLCVFTTTAEMTDEFGRFPAELKVTKTGLTLFTANFYMDGERNTHPEGTTDGSQETVIPELTQLVERVEDAASSVLDMTVVANTLPAGSDATYSYDEETNTATFGIPKGADGSLASGVLAPTYSSSSTYAVGDYVYYSGSLYRCTTAITTAEAWTSGHWTQVALAPEVSDLKSDLDTVSDRFAVNIKDAVQGKYITTSNTIGNNASMGYIFIPYTGGDFEIVGSDLDGIISYWNADKSSALGNSGWVYIKGTYFENNIPDGTKYIGLSFKLADINTIIVWLNRGAEIGSLGKKIDLISKHFLYNTDGYVAGKYINYQGAVMNNVDLAYVFIPYADGDVYITGLNSSSETLVKFWNSAKSTVLGGDSGWNGDISRYFSAEEIPTGTAYLSISFKLADADTMTIFVEQGAKIFALANGYGTSINEIREETKQARHVPSGTTPLTLLHFSDIHADTSAMNRIVGQGGTLGSLVDEVVCTGDMTVNAYGDISSWWDENVLTVIGNHDTAKYENGVYDWTYLTMAQRDTYYITPFESNWSITHTSGKSYYYKDYASSNVRLIVLDYMLYWDDPESTDAVAQTSWLANLLSDAITNGLHVLIAVHGPIYDPNDGALSVVPCQFSKGDNTFDSSNVLGFYPPVRAVKSAIANGLNFIGYICGHTHQDNIFKTPDNQMFYCVTCGIVSNYNQWKDSDMHRDAENDAYNLVTIDTTSTLIKLVRGGGADMDNRLRPRRTLTVDYATGNIVGEDK